MASTYTNRLGLEKQTDEDLTPFHNATTAQHCGNKVQELVYGIS